MLKKENGRPLAADGRLDKEIRTYDLLDELHIPYERVDHEAAFTMEACAEIDEALGVTMCKNLFLQNRQGTEFYILLMPDRRFKTKELSGQLGIARLSFSDGERMERFLDITPGSLSVLGLMNDKENAVRLLIDKTLLEGAYIGVHPCVNTASLKIAVKDILDVFLPAVHHTPTFVTLTYEE